MSDLSYAYKPKALSMALGLAFFAVCGVVLVNMARTNTAGLIINGLIDLGPADATLVYWGLASCSAIFCVLALLGIARGLTSAQKLTLGATGIRLPKSAFSDSLVSVDYAHIRDMERQQIKGQHFLIIHHVHGKTTVTASMLPDQAIFDKVCRTVTERVIQSRQG